MQEWYLQINKETLANVVSCTVLRIPGEHNILLDCGEATLLSLKRYFSSRFEYLNFFTNLRTIYISHLHADHHLGIIGVIKEYTGIQKSLPVNKRQPIFVVGPWRLLASLYEYDQVEDIGMEEFVIPFSSYNLIPRHLLPQPSGPQSLDLGLFQGLLTTMNLRSFETCFVPHCHHAYGVALTHKSGWKIVYSGDCRPSGDLVEIGRNATVCIHEATVADSQPQDALDKMHSTTSEAIMIGRRMGAQHTLLTHFSQRWSKIPEFVIEWDKHQDEAERFETVGIAFDRMTVKVKDMWKLPLMYPAFQAMYPEEKRWLKQKDEQEDAMTAGKATAEEDPLNKKRKRADSEENVALEIGQIG